MSTITFYFATGTVSQTKNGSTALSLRKEFDDARKNGKSIALLSRRGIGDVIINPDNVLYITVED